MVPQAAVAVLRHKPGSHIKASINDFLMIMILMHPCSIHLSFSQTSLQRNILMKQNSFMTPNNGIVFSIHSSLKYSVDFVTFFTIYIYIYFEPLYQLNQA